MKHRFMWLAMLPISMMFSNGADAGLRCGGCSDPCRGSAIGHGHHVNVFRSNGYAAGACAGGGYGYGAVVQAAPSSCGYVAADGSYGYAHSAPSQSINVTVQANVVSGQAYSIAPSVTQVQSVPASVQLAPQVVCEPVTGYRTVMESTFVTETQYRTVMETRNETQVRVRKVSKTVPVTFEDFRVKTVMVPRTETKTIEYSVLIPEQSTKTVDVNVSVPVWNEVSENYTVKVPRLVEVQEAYNVRVPRLRDESFTYAVQVPQTEVVTKLQTVTNAVPVVKTRTVQRVVPSYKTQSVTKDYGHWETVVEEVAGSSYQVSNAPQVTCSTSAVSSGCGAVATSGSVVYGGGCGSSMFRASGCNTGCAPKAACGTRKSCGCASGSHCGSCASASGGCGCSAAAANGCGHAVVGGTVSQVAMGSGCGVASSVAVAAAPTTATRRVWVPNVVTEEVPVVVNETRTEEISFTVYEQQSTQIPYECTNVVYRTEERTGTRKVVDYAEEQRTRTRKVVEYQDEQRTRVRRELSYKMETKQESYPVVSYRTEKRTKEISFTINEPTQTVEPFQSTRYETVTEDVPEEYTVAVQVPVVKEVQVQVCRMVPKLVPYTFNPCSVSSASVGTQLVGGNVVTTSGCGQVGGNGQVGCGHASGLSSLNGGGCGCGQSAPAPSPCGCGR